MCCRDSSLKNKAPSRMVCHHGWRRWTQNSTTITTNLYLHYKIRVTILLTQVGCVKENVKTTWNAGNIPTSWSLLSCSEWVSEWVLKLSIGWWQQPKEHQSVFLLLDQQVFYQYYYNWHYYSLSQSTPQVPFSFINPQIPLSLSVL